VLRPSDRSIGAARAEEHANRLTLTPFTTVRLAAARRLRGKLSSPPPRLAPAGDLRRGVVARRPAVADAVWKRPALVAIAAEAAAEPWSLDLGLTA